MNFDEGYRRLSIVVAVIGGPILLFEALVSSGSRQLRPDQIHYVVLYLGMFSLGVWLALYLARKACKWVMAGFRAGSSDQSVRCDERAGQSV